MKQKKRLTVAGILCFGLMMGFLTFETARAQVINLKFANFFPPPAKQSLICEEFIKDLEMRTGGRIKVKYYPGGSLLNGPGMYKGIVGGIADIGYSHVYYTPGRFPVTEMVGLPLGNQTSWTGVTIPFISL